MKTILILGAGLYQVPAIVKAKAMGIRTVACSYLADDPGLAIADAGHTVSTTDKEAILAVAKKEGIDGVTTGASDVAVSTVGYVNDELGLRGLTIEQARIFSRKDMFRRFLRTNGLPHPEFHVFDELDSFRETCATLKGRYIVKPVDSSGSKGVHELHLPFGGNTEALESIFSAAHRSSMCGRVIVEGFLNGIEHGGDAFFSDGELVTANITNKQLNGPPHYVPVGHMIPSDLSDRETANVLQAIQDTVSLIGFRDGVVNFDIMVDDNGSARVLEMSPRYGGNCIPTIIEHGTGFDEISANIACAIGSDPAPYIQSIRKQVECTASRILGASHSGTVVRVPRADELTRRYGEALKEITFDVVPGDTVSEFVSGGLRIGHFIAAAKTREVLERIVLAIESEAAVDVEAPG